MGPDTRVLSEKTMSTDGYYTCDTCDEGTPPLIRPPTPPTPSSSDASNCTAHSAAVTVCAPTAPTTNKNTVRQRREERRRRSFAARRLQAAVRGFLARRRDALRRALEPKPKPKRNVKATQFRCATPGCRLFWLKPAQVAALARRGGAPTLCFACFRDRHQRPRQATTDVDVSFDCAVCACSTRVHANTYARIRNSVPAHLPLVCPPCHRHMRGNGHDLYIANATRVQQAWRRRLAAKAAQRRASLKLQAAARGAHARRCARGLRVMRLLVPPPASPPAAPVPPPTPMPVPAFSPTPAFFELLVEQRVAAALEQRTAAALEERVAAALEERTAAALAQQQIMWQRWQAEQQAQRERAIFEHQQAVERRRERRLYVANYPNL